jgi:hypothetical protein
LVVPDVFVDTTLGFADTDADRTLVRSTVGTVLTVETVSVCVLETPPAVAITSKDPLAVGAVNA